MLNSNFSGEVMVFVNEREGRKSYSIGISKKMQDDIHYENGYMPVKFKKDVSVDNKTKIDIKKAWLSFYRTVPEGRTVPFIFISEFEVTETHGLEAPSEFKPVEEPEKLPF